MMAIPTVAASQAMKALLIIKSSPYCNNEGEKEEIDEGEKPQWGTYHFFKGHER